MITQNTFSFGAIERPLRIGNKKEGADHFSVVGSINNCTGVELDNPHGVPIMLRNAAEVRALSRALAGAATGALAIPPSGKLTYTETDTAPECADDGYEGCADFTVHIAREGEELFVEGKFFSVPIREVPFFCAALDWLADNWANVIARLGTDEPLEGLL